jgi:hypothetical protein
MTVQLCISQTGSTVSDTLTRKKELTKDEIDILNTFRINDQAKNQVIDTLIKYISQDSTFIEKLKEKATILEDDKKILTKAVSEKTKEVSELSDKNATLDKKLRRTRKIGVVSSVFMGILGSLLTLIYV